MKTVEIPDAAFEELEALRRAKGVTRAEALAQAISESLQQAKFLKEWESRKPTSAAAELSDDEVERVAAEAIREARRARRK
jgi:metal-responsive CopG/Arc/MetJ family transcriptional regulator